MLHRASTTAKIRKFLREMASLIPLLCPADFWENLQSHYQAASHQWAFHLLKPHIDTCLFIATALHHSFKHISICEYKIKWTLMHWPQNTPARNRRQSSLKVKLQLVVVPQLPLTWPVPAEDARPFPNQPIWTAPKGCKDSSTSWLHPTHL